MKDALSAAASLLDGGWRAEDREELISEYELTEEEADEICKLLEDFSKKTTAELGVEIV